MNVFQECFGRIRFSVFFLVLSGSVATTLESAGADISTVKGTVTWMDPGRGLVVVQDDTNATAVRLESLRNLEPGQCVELKGTKLPFFPAAANYPDRPSNSEFRGSFEGPTNRGTYYLSQMQGFLLPPFTGEYRFWIASDDSSELWFSTNSDPGNARRIAYVPGGRWTNPRQWDHFSSQQSAPILLEAGKSYYIKAIAQQSAGRDYLGVAWAGPAISQSVIDGRYLVPWMDPGNDKNGSVRQNGIFWESWSSFFSSDLSVLRLPDEFICNFHPMQISRLTERTNPGPLRISPGQTLSRQQNFNLVEVEGRLNFTAKSGQYLELELSDVKNSRNTISVQTRQGEPWARVPEKSLVRVRGVCEGIRGDDGRLRAKLLWVNDVTNITWPDVADNWTVMEPLAISLLSESNLDLADSEWTRIHGRLAQKEPDGLWEIQGDDSFYGYTSKDGTNWASIGPPVELSMSNSMLAGFAVSSHQAEKTARAEFSDVRGLSRKLTGADIGDSSVAGRGSIRASSYVIDGCGNDIWSSSDQCYFYFQPATGEQELIAQLVNFKADDTQAKACLMIRESLDSGAPWAAMVVTRNGTVGLQARQEPDNRAAGALAANSATWIKVVRRRNVFFAHFESNKGLTAGQPIEILGSLEWRDGEAFLNNARYRPVIDRVSTNSYNLSLPEFSSFRTVQIGNMARESERAILTANTPRFRISGVVTFNQMVDGSPLLVVQDASGACSVKFSTGGEIKPVNVGQLIEVTGYQNGLTHGQEFLANGFSVMGEGTMPAPLKFPLDVSESGHSPGAWVEVEGVGRSINPDGQLLVMTRAGILPVWCENIAPNRLAECINSKVRIRGIYWKTTNPMLLLPSDKFIDVIEPSPEHPFAMPEVSFALLQGQSFENPFARRVKISGVVTDIRNHSFFVQNGIYGAQIDSSNTNAVKVGDPVEVVGFCSERPTGMLLSDSMVRVKDERATLPSPAQLSMDDVMDGHNNGLIVSIDARILEQRVINGMQTLDLQNGQRAFQASLPVENGQLPPFITGSKVRVVGVSRTESVSPGSMETAGSDRPLIASLELLLRTPQDVTILERPPWWNWKYTAVAIGVPVSALIGSTLWIHTLRRRVELRTKQLQETMAKLQKETQSAAILAERDRLAGEIHDSVEQGLSAIIMQMEAASKFVDQPDTVSSYLNMAKNMASFSRSEVQHAVWNLQSPMFENADLPAVLRRVSREISVGDSPHVTVKILGQVRPLPSALEHHLLRIGQEALTNAIKHGQPNLIEMTLSYGSERLSFTVHDDGRGFDPGLPGRGDGNFGLIGMKTRAQKLNATLNLNSRPNGGTTIELIVPLENVSVTKP
jgi:signal transduction histidine kinase